MPGARLRLHKKYDAVESNGPDEYEEQGDREEEQKREVRALPFEQRARRIARIEIASFAGAGRPAAGEENSFAIGPTGAGTAQGLARGPCVAEIRKPRRTVARFEHFAFDDLARDRLPRVRAAEAIASRTIIAPKKRPKTKKGTKTQPTARDAAFGIGC